MNLVNSKVIKSSRPIINRSIETVAAYSCELYIQSFKIVHRGYVYFLWSSNNAQIHSLRYESTGKVVPVKETLTISLRITAKNGRELPSSTFLKLMAESGEELDQFEMAMNSLSPQFKEMEVPMDRGLVSIRVRRKAMNIGEDEEINFQGGFYRSLQDKSLLNVGSGEYESLQEELSRIKKELEDAIYLNNKLKNDRDVLLATKQELQLEIQTMIIQITKEISVLREHYDNRIAIREHCYEEEIQDLVNTFNSNADQTKKTLEMILKQKIKLEEDLKPLAERLKTMETEIAQKNADCAAISEEKIRLEIKLTQAEDGGHERDRAIEGLHQQLQQMQGQINSRNKQIESLNYDINNKDETITDLKSTISELGKRISDDEALLHEKDEHIFQLQANILQLQQRQRCHENEGQLLRKQIGLLEQQKKGYLGQIESLTAKLQQFQYQMQFNENVMGQLKKQQTQKEEQLYSQLQGLEKLYSQRMEDIINNYQREKDQLLFHNQNLQQEKLQLQHKIHQLQQNLKGSELKLTQMDNQLNYLSNQIRNTQGTAGEKEQTIGRLMKEVDRLNVQIENMHAMAMERKPSEKKIEHVQVGSKSTELHKAMNQQLMDKNNTLEAEIKRLAELLEKNNKQLQKTKEEKQSLEKQVQQKAEERSQKQKKHSKKNSDHEVEAILKNGSINEEQVLKIVDAKQREISQLRYRVDYLQKIYQAISSKLDQIARKYPHIDIGTLPIPKPQQICDSEQQQEKILNNALINQNNTSPRRKVDRRDSIGATIMERDEDALSNPSVKYRSNEPRSQQKIGDGYRRGIIRRESLAGKVTIQVPKDTPAIRRQQSHGSYDASERSGTSYVKVSHSKKIRQLQNEVSALNEKLKGYEGQIDDYIKKIDSLKKELDSKKHVTEKIQPVQQIRRENKESQVFIEDQRVKNFMQQSQIKQLQMQKMYLRLGQLEDNLKNQKADAFKKINSLQIRISEYDKRIQEANRRSDGLAEINRNLQKLNEELQQKLRKEKQAAQETRLAVKQLQMHLQNAQNQLKKLKSHNQVLEQRVQKLMGSEAVIKQLSRQLDELNKKLLDQTRVINHLKLQKDAVQEQLRLLKKRQNEHVRIATEWQEKAASLERALEQQKRKEGKLKRQIDEIQQQVRRSKLNTKKVEEQLQSLNSSQITWQAQRRKHLDEISNLQDQVSRKDYQYTKLMKQVQKWKARAQQKEEARMGKKSQLREEIDRLESELIRKEKKLLEQTQQNKLLRGRLQLLQRQNKRIMQQKNQSYGQKLKYYVEQMSNIKKLLSQYQDQNSRLKIDNNDLYEQSQILRMNYDKIQIKYEQNMEREETILNDLQSYINQVGVLKDRLGQANSELDQAQAAFMNIRKQIDQQKLQNRRLSQKYEASERNLERASVQIKDLKIKISEYQTNNEINGKMGERYRALQRKKGQLEEQYRRLKMEYDNIINLFVYKRQDLEKAVSEARTQQRRLKDEQVQKISEECSKLITNKTQRLQQEIMDMYNENNRLRAENQALIEDNGRMKGKILELEMIAQRFTSLQGQNDTYRYSIDELKEEIRKKNDKISKMDLSIQAIEVECNIKERDIISYKNRIQQIQKDIQKLNNQLSARKASQRQLQDAILRSGQAKQRQKSEQQFHFKQRQAKLVQQYESKLRALDLENQSLKEKAARSVEQHNAKIKKLEQKMDEMEEALKERQKAIQSNYQAQIHELQSQLLRLSQQLQQKMNRIDELNEGILILEDENKDLTKQMQQVKYQFQQQRQILDAQLNRLKNKLKEAETTYAANLKSLEEEVLKNAQKNNISGSRVKTSEAEDRIAKRYEDKLKNKDRKIEQLKENIYALEQTIVKLRKKQSSYEATLTELERLKISIVQFEKQRKNIETKYEEELNRNADTIRQLKRQILICKQSEEKLRLLSQQKIFQLESISCELKTMRQLYQQLQRQLQKRKNNLTAQLQEQSSIQLQLRTKQGKILQLEERLMDLSKTNKEMDVEVKRKNIQIKKYVQMINDFQKKQQKYVEDITKMTNQLAFAKKSSQQMSSASQLSKTEVTKMRNQLTKLRKNQQQLKAALANKQQSAVQLKRLYDDLLIRFKQADEISQKYNIINQRSRQHLGYGIQQIIDRFLMHLQQKDAQINQLVQQVEELKFLNQRKYLDYDQLKKQNIQLQLKAQDLDVLNDQLETLRKICDKLEQQKKNSVFREEVLRMQLQSLASGGNPDLRNRIEAILNNPTIPSYSNFSFYNM